MDRDDISILGWFSLRDALLTQWTCWMILLFRGASQKLTLVVDDCCNRDPDVRFEVLGVFMCLSEFGVFFNQVARLLIGIGSLLHEMTEPSRVRRGSLRKSVWSPRVPRKMLQVLSVSTFFIVIAIWTNGMGGRGCLKK